MAPAHPETERNLSSRVRRREAHTYPKGDMPVRLELATMLSDRLPVP